VLPPPQWCFYTVKALQIIIMYPTFQDVRKKDFERFHLKEIIQVLPGDWYQWEERTYKEKVEEGECSRNIMYSPLQMEK
jgi:hypothetical protein